MIDFKTRRLAKGIEREIAQSDREVREEHGNQPAVLHPKTIRGMALFEAMNRGVPVGSYLCGLANLVIRAIDECQGMGVQPPDELWEATRPLSVLMGNIIAQKSLQSRPRASEGF